MLKLLILYWKNVYRMWILFVFYNKDITIR